MQNERVEFLLETRNLPSGDFFMPFQNTFLFLLQTKLYEPYFFVRFDAPFRGHF